jgi:hypothetical protein
MSENSQIDSLSRELVELKKELSKLRRDHSESLRYLDAFGLEGKRLPDLIGRLAVKHRKLLRRCESIEEGIRYRLGDTLVAAMNPSRNTLLLPWKVSSLLAEGMLRRVKRHGVDRQFKDWLTAGARRTELRIRRVLEIAGSVAGSTEQGPRQSPVAGAKAKTVIVDLGADGAIVERVRRHFGSRNDVLVSQDVQNVADLGSGGEISEAASLVVTDKVDEQFDLLLGAGVPTVLFLVGAGPAVKRRVLQAHRAHAVVGVFYEPDLEFALDVALTESMQDLLPERSAELEGRSEYKSSVAAGAA